MWAKSASSTSKFSRPSSARASALPAVAQDARELLGLLHRGLDPVHGELLRALLDVVDDVVDRPGERVDVVAVERGDPAAVKALDDLVCDPVPLLLAA